MKSIQRILFTFLLVTVFSFITLAQNVVVKQSNKSGIYKKGEKIVVTASLNEMDADSILVKTRVNYSNDVTVKKFKYTGKDVEIYTSSFDKPTSVIFYVTAGDVTTSLGLVVDPGNFKPGTKYPRDLKKYWKAEKKVLHALPMKVKSTPVSDVDDGYVCSDIEINCTGPKPARGYFAKPGSAAKKSLPIVLVVHAAGVNGSWCLAKPQNALRYAKIGALCFDLNAHGMLNGQPQEYYDNLAKGELKGYMTFGLENRDSVYFRGIYLRLLRTLDFLTSQPEWDGKRIIVIGESQGGGQALAAAGLDDRVSVAVATVPAMCDWGRTLKGEKGGWPNPYSTNNDRKKMMKALPYFDVAHLLKGSKATIVTEIGFIDETCPSSSVYAAINQSKGEKKVFGVPYREHLLRLKGELRKEWEETVWKPKNVFIEDFIK